MDLDGERFVEYGGWRSEEWSRKWGVEWSWKRAEEWSLKKGNEISCGGDRWAEGTGGFIPHCPQK